MGRSRASPSLYWLFKAAVRLAVAVFYRRVEIHHPDRIPARGPVLLAANHPNSITDPMVLGARMPRKVNYLAHHGLFRNPVWGWFLHRFGVIPVYRREDFPGEAPSNLLTFLRCYEALEAGEMIGIFPEGTSQRDPRVQRLKTGAARITLEAEARNGFRLSLKVIPVGLHFENRARFRSTVLINIGRPIEAAAYRESYMKEPTGAVSQLTGDLHEALRRLTVDIERGDLVLLIQDLEQIYLGELKRQGLTPVELSSPVIQDFFLAKGIARAVQHYYQTDPHRVAQVWKSLLRYKRQLKRLNLNDKIVREDRRAISLLRNLAMILLLTLLGFPLAIYGTLNNYLPYKISELCGRWLVSDETKVASAELLGGGIAFLLFYTLQGTGMGLWLGVGPALLYLVSLPPSGFYALWFIRRYHRYRHRLRYAVLFLRDRHLLRKLRVERQRLIRMLDLIKDEYLATQPATVQG